MSLVPSTILSKIEDANVREELSNGKHADGSPIRSYADLTAPQVRAINIATYGPEDSPRKSVTMPGGNISVEIGWYTLQELADLSGIEEVKPKMVPQVDPNGQPVLDDEGEPVLIADKNSMLEYHFGVTTGRGGKKQTTLYRMRNQELNRPLDTDKARALGDIMAAGRWAGNGESLLFAEGPNDDPQGLSSQHRNVGAFLAVVEGKASPDMRVPAIVVRGLPLIFAGSVDKGRNRTTSDQTYLDPSIFPAESLHDASGKPLAPNLINEARQKLGRDLTSSLTVLGYRLSGRDVNASKGANMAPTAVDEQAYRVLDAFGDTPLQDLVQLVRNMDHAMGDGSTFGRLWGRQYVVAALALHFARETVGDVWFDPRTVERNTFTIDLSEAERFLRALNLAVVGQPGESPEEQRLGTQWANYIAKCGGKRPEYRPTNREKMASVANAVSSFFTGSVLARTRSEGSVLPHAAAIVARTKDTAATYPNFGGPDTPAGERKTDAPVEADE